jgi:hypothetical protein
MREGVFLRLLVYRLQSANSREALCVLHAGFVVQGTSLPGTYLIIFDI